ncbi:MAG: thioredoxin family protein [Bacteroidales bacterium]
MRTLISLFTLVILVGMLPVSAQESKKEEKTGIDFFKGTWDEALKKAKKENKLIFLDVFAAWCGPCKRLDALTFSDQEVGKYYNKHFINFKANGEKDEGLLLRQRYSVRAYPTLLFIDHTGAVVKAASGFRPPENFIELGKSVANK